MNRRRFLPTYHYEDTTDSLLLESAGKPLRDYKIYGNSVQNGTPTPDAPVEIQSVGNKTVNLIDVYSLYSTKTYEANGMTITVGSDGTITINGTATSSMGFAANVFSLPKGKYKLYDFAKGEFPDILHWRSRLYNAGLTDVPFISHNANSATGVYFELSDTTELKFGVQFRNGYTYNNCVLRPMVVEVTDSSEEFSYEPYGKYKMSVKIIGKNLLPVPSDLEFTRVLTLDTVYLEPGTYTLSIGGYTSTYEKKLTTIRFDFEDGTYKTYSFGEDRPKQTITLTQKAYIKYIYAYSDYSGSNGVTVNIKNLMLEKGEEATDYEPYIEPITTNIYLAEPLRKAGEYADYVDFSNGCVVRNTQKVVLTSASNPWTYTRDGKIGVAFSDVLAGAANYLPGLCTHTNKVQSGNEQNVLWCGVDDSAIYWIGIRDILGLDIPGFKNWLDSQEIPVEVVCGRATPITEPIDLPKIPTAKGTVNITVETDIEPSDATWQYYRK